MRLISLLFTIHILLFLASCNNTPEQPAEVIEEIIPPKFEYGINVDSLNVIHATVKRNEFLSDILLKYNVDYAIIDQLARTTRDTFDVRKIRAGNKYAVITTTDSIQKPLYFVYEISASNYVLYQLTESVYAVRGQKEIIVKTDTLSGTINSSLWNAIADDGQDPSLSISLSEIYSWTIDFFGLQKGDNFTAIYDEYFVEEEYIGPGKVYAARFMHGGKNMYAFYFEQNGKGDYFDEIGNSLQRTFLKAPLKYSRISSRFSNSRLHPVLKIRRPHHGVDYAAPSGTPVFSVGSGTVVAKGYQKTGGGNYIKIKHNSVYTTSYMHLQGFAKGISVGKQVSQGELIGYVGKTGLATGPHLDFRFYKNGQAVDPLKVESPPSKPIEEQYRPAFDSVVSYYIGHLGD
jgi:murein DD-endopeptidase MepM/ murein hydrolase activator NlpD